MMSYDGFRSRRAILDIGVLFTSSLSGTHLVQHNPGIPCSFRFEKTQAGSAAESLLYDIAFSSPNE